MSRKLSIITHRGIDPDVPEFPAESSLSAFETHLARGYGIEFDFQLTADNVPVVIHDESLRRISKCADTRLIKNTTWNKISDIRGVQISTLDEIVGLIGRYPRATLSALHYKGALQNEHTSDLLVRSLEPLDSSRFIIFDAKPETARYLKSKRKNLQIAASVAHPYDIERYGTLTHGTLLSIRETISHKSVFDWAWMDEWDLENKNGSKHFYTQENFDHLRDAGFKIALVTPELHATSPGLLGGESHADARNRKSLEKRIRAIIDLSPDALCTDHPDLVADIRTSKMKIALQNLHHFGGILGTAFHGYVRHLVANGHITHLYFDDLSFSDDALRQIRKAYGASDLGLDKAKVIFNAEELNHECDILLNFSSDKRQFTQAVKNFKGLKVFHVMDYFWNEPLSEKNARLREYGIDYVMSYGSPDVYDSYFKKYAPDYLGKVIPVPFGYAPRFEAIVPFVERKKRCVAVGSVRPLRFENEDPKNWKEEADFFATEKWFHKFRRMLIEKKSDLTGVIDSMLPEWPRYRDYDYDMVAKFNEYRMFISDESIFYFPSAKAFEGPATGCVMACSDHQCFKDFGFENGVNCVTHKEFDIVDAKKVLEESLANENILATISENGRRFVGDCYSHETIAAKLTHIIRDINNGDIRGTLADHSYAIWRTPLSNLHQPRTTAESKLRLSALVYTYPGYVYYLLMEAKYYATKAFRKIHQRLVT